MFHIGNWKSLWVSAWGPEFFFHTCHHALFEASSGDVRFFFETRITHVGAHENQRVMIVFLLNTKLFFFSRMWGIRMDQDLSENLGLQ